MNLKSFEVIFVVNTQLSSFVRILRLSKNSTQGFVHEAPDSTDLVWSSYENAFEKKQR